MNAESDVCEAKGNQPGLWVTVRPGERAIALLAALGMLGVLLVARWLNPDPRGLGTHEQLGLLPCFTAARFGIPCPFCGMTTAFSHMAHLHFLEAFFAQPAGALAFCLMLVAIVLAVGVAAFGRRPSIRLRPGQWKALWISVLVLLGSAWAYKIISYAVSG